ncbi:MAG TPA: biotin-independent malonate decarboxylase subunit gamma [Burkholderiales bacterium]|nr:biotin-independent malonate decarboxylase subunit gamma [Burkholderiales bacterium]
MSGDAFSASPPAQRVTALLDNGTLDRGQAHASGSLIAGFGSMGGKEVTIVATDRHVAGGSLGVAESHALAALMEESHAAHRPVVLCLDSAGARLDEGLPALGAFRQLYRRMLDLRLAGLPMLALLGRDCFGGASMLAATCEKRVFSAKSRLAMSGPAVIHALGGAAELDADDVSAVTALMGGAARQRLSPTDGLCADTIDAYRKEARDWLDSGTQAGTPDLTLQHTRLGTRLLAQGVTPSPPQEAADSLPAVLQEIIPEGIKTQKMDGVLVGRNGKSTLNAFFGFIDGKPVDALAAWTLAGECLTMAEERPGEAVTVFLDSPGQAPTHRDEKLMLSEYIAHLALVLTSLRQNGHRVTLQVLGDAAGGIYVALAAPSVRVVALPGANVQVLPPAAVARVLHRRTEVDGVEDYMRAGVIDTLM